MASIQTLEQRVRALEARLAEVEGGYANTLYRLQRDVVGTRLDIRKVLTHLSIPATTEDEIDAVLDEG
jgi:uncharacterized coiled-coil protein SlyX